MKKQSKQPISKLQRKLWQVCRELATKLYPPHCYTCGAKNLEGSNRQLGHMWAKASLGAKLKYDIRVLRWQCAVCNLWRGGMGADFYKRMLNEIGEDKMRELEKERQQLVRAYDHYTLLLNEYTNRLQSIK